MDLKKIEKLMQLMNKHSVGELEYEEEAGKIKLSTGNKEVVYTAASAPVATSPVVSSAAPSEAPPAEAKKNMSGRAMNSPFVGTFYRAPSPEAAPFIKVGDTVKKGDVLCIIEAMKLMNEIEAEQDGVVRDILVENGQPVEFDQALFILE